MADDGRGQAPGRIGAFFLWLLLAVPAGYALGFATDLRTATFVVSILGIVPLARIIGYATKELALQTNPTISGLLSATFGNVIELIIALFALERGVMRVVQASLIGSIIGNILLLMGLSIFTGGLRFKQQRFNRDSVGVSSTMLIIAVTGLAVPTIYSWLPEHHGASVQILSDAVAIVLAITYVCGLLFSLRTHRDLFDASDEIRESRERPSISKKRAASILFAATLAVVGLSELVVREVEVAAATLGITETFVGIVIIAIITNIAEKANAVHFAREGKLDISLEIGLSSAIQIALFVVPILVLVSELSGYGFSLVFSPFEIVGVFFAVTIVNHLAADGVCNWLEGVQLMAVYLIIAATFFFL